jgi:SAM-dependent methyltransferase
MPASGTGPGTITPDGCAVEFYALLEPTGEPEIVHAAVPAGASILELGAGAGRVTHRLVALGHPVVAVDESAEMLAHIRGVNTDDRDLPGRWLQACSRHLRDDGCLLVQRHPPGWFDEAAEGERVTEGIVFRLRDLRRLGPGLLEATAEYQVGERVWTQTFTAERLDDEALAAALAQAGLAVDAYLTGDGSWVRAVPASSGRALGRSPR